MTFKEQLTALSSVKFPLMMAIVCIHVQGEVTLGTFDYYYMKFWVEDVGRIGVPLFFFISGILFFCNVNKGMGFGEYVDNVYKIKVKKRLHTLLMPYFVWNLISLLFFVLKGDVVLDRGVVSHFLWDYKYDGYWFFPINGVFWFIRDLFLTALLSPLIYVIINRCNWKIGMFLFLFFFIVMETQFFLGSLVEVLLIFTMGAFIGLNRIGLIDIFQKRKLQILFLYFIFAGIYLFCLNSGRSYVIGNMVIVLGAITFVNLMYKFPLMYKGISLLSLSMFIFASHAILRFFVIYLLCQLDIEFFWIEYTLRVILTVSLCIACFWVIERFFPRLMSLLTGGR